MKVKSLSRVRLPATPWTAAYQAPPSMGFSRQEYWREVTLLLVNVNSKECWSKSTSNILDGLSPENYPKAMVSLFI